MRRLLAAALTLALAACVSETPEDNQPGLSGDCGHPGGTLLGCDDGPIENADDACQKLIDCGIIPLINDSFDRQDCLREIRALPPARQDFLFSCVEASSCDQLGDLSPCFRGLD